MTTDAQVEALTRTVIAQKTDELLARERELTERAALMFKNGKGRSAPSVPDRDRRAHDRARELLNGAGGLLRPLPEDNTEADVLLERESVRIALGALQNADLQQQAVEAAQWAIKATPQFQALQREWLLAAARFMGVEQRAQEFLDAATGARHDALPWSGVPIGRGATIDPGLMGLWGTWSTIEEVTDAAVVAGVVTRSDVDKARRGRGDA